MNDPLPPDDTRLDYKGQGDAGIDFAYYDMPGGATIVLIDAVSGASLESGSIALDSGGTGKANYPIEDGTPKGTYYLAAMDAAGDAVIAQTVEFTLADED
ncbi:MAG TPA: hypothetical protein VHS78_02575 [Candidatus Elarobacter sp.]|nr:hypothetical protein [Candidatus Elarobacter sp.]